MNYKKLMGYGDTKKVTKKVSKLKVNKVLENIKEEFGLVKEVGATAEYRKYYKNIEKTENVQAKQVNNLVQLLMKKGLKKEATAIASKYVKGVAEFDNFLKKLIGKMM